MTRLTESQRQSAALDPRSRMVVAAAYGISIEYLAQLRRRYRDKADAAPARKPMPKRHYQVDWGARS